MDGDYFDGFNPVILELIPPDVRTVLEVGCGAGRLCEAYRRRNPGVEWCGIEANRVACEAANGPGRCNFAVPLPVELCDFDEPGFPENLADVLVAGDILEHLVDPWEQLRRLAHLVKPGGLAIASVPNVGHASVLLAHLKGEWRYADAGLMDRTHLRWFDLQGVKDLFTGAGLEIVDVRSRNMGCDPAMWSELHRWIAPGIADQAFWRRAQAFQWVVRARRPAPASLAPRPIEPLHLHAVLDRGHGNGTVSIAPRVLWPFEALATIPGVRTSVDDITGAAAMPDRHGAIPADRDAVLIFQRSHGDRARCREIAGRVLAEKPRCVLVYEIDDHPSILPDPAILACFHAVTVSTGPLAEVVRQWNPNVFVVPNQLPEIPPLEPKDATPSIFFGALNREDAWRPIMPALNRVLADYPGLSVTVVHDRAFFDAIEHDKTFFEFLPYDRYRELLRAHAIAILPLGDSPFDRCKSPLKFLEAAAEGVACVMSDTVYGDVWCGPEGPRAACYRTPAGFEAGLRMLIDQPGLRRACAERAHAYVRDHRLIGRHYRDRYDLYRGLLARKAELDAGLVERLESMTILSRS